MALRASLIQEMVDHGRRIVVAEAGDETLGPLRMLPGVWKNTAELHGFGFNLIALPFAPAIPNGYRLMMNQYDEELHFSIVDKGVPNRGFDATVNPPAIADQTIVALDYDQKITQIAADDFPRSGETEKFNGKPIHKEPGLWLYMTDQNVEGINIARLGSIPHGNSVLAIGRAREEPFPGLPQGIVPRVNGVVVGGGTDPREDDFPSPYFDPYKHFHQHPFMGSVPIDGFTGFEPVDTTLLLRHVLENVLTKIGDVKRTMRLHVDSTLDHAGITNIPFIVRQADAAEMNSTFLIYEIEDKTTGRIRHFMQYVQNVILDFIGRPDGHPGRARWPHISINTMERVEDVGDQDVKMKMLTE
jgi:hypothetical protein